ncbi:MAG: HAD hydrolase-like protein [Bacteroidia bacterium]|nr:HAD hydrolase-like protein [Bacteroidia bacterium]
MLAERIKIFFDLDGTIIDSKNRLYDLFVALTGIDISFDEYWLIKKDMVSNEDILNRFLYTPDQIKSFRANWMDKIEQPEYLNKDQKFTFTQDVLETLQSNNYELYLITARQSKERVKVQLQDLDLLKYFKKLLVTEQKVKKQYLITQLDIKLSKNDFMVGDTGMDILTGKRIGVKTVAVLTGFRSKEQLLIYSPDFIYNDILEFSKNINSSK